MAHYPPNETNSTRQILFDRDSRGRIIALYDPAAGEDGPAVVQYEYNSVSGNLFRVGRLVDRSSQTYELTFWR
jgi:hypothetical protein